MVHYEVTYMNLKLIGAVMIIVCCSGFGFSLAARHLDEIQCYKVLIKILEYMSWELHYRLTPLPQLCRQAAMHGKHRIFTVFQKFAAELDNQVAPDAYACMQNVTNRTANLPDSVKESIMELSECLGRFDLEGQLQGIESTRNLCFAKLNDLEKNKDVRLRSYQTLGICAGAAVVILLI